VPFGLGDEELQELLRVDGKSASLATLAAFALLLALPVLAFGLAPANTVTGLALPALGLAITRLLLGVGAAVDYPFVTKALQTSAWVVVALPWFVIALGTLHSARQHPRWHAVAHGVYAALTAALAWMLFPDSTTSALVFSAMIVSVGGVRVAAAFDAPAAFTTRAASSLRLQQVTDRMRRVSIGRFPGSTGLRYALPLLALRAVLFVFGAHEAITAGGTRIALSTFYTPLALAALAQVLWIEFSSSAPRLLFRVFVSGGVFIGLAFAVVGWMVSDTGIALVTALGPLALLYWLALRWPASGPSTHVRRLALTFPLALFIALQVRADLVPYLGDGEGTSYQTARLDANALRVIGQSDPQQLVGLGLRQSEALGVMYETMSRYTSGPGLGYLHNEVSVELKATSVREHVVSALLAAQWGASGPIALLFLLGAFAACAIWMHFARPGGGAAVSAFEGVAWLGGTTFALWLLWLPLGLLPRPWGFVACVLLPIVAMTYLTWASEGPAAAQTPVVPTARSRTLATLFVLTFALSGIYMVLANYGLVAFTGKNVYGLGLDSISDIIESTALLGGGVWLATRPVPSQAGRTA
jgi:hypothetical protein